MWGGDSEKVSFICNDKIQHEQDRVAYHIRVICKGRTRSWEDRSSLLECGISEVHLCGN
jgi:hypothetical protein